MFPDGLAEAITERKSFCGKLNIPQKDFPDWNQLVPYFDQSFLNGNRRARDPHKVFAAVKRRDFPIVDKVSVHLAKIVNSINISCHCYAGFSPNAIASPVHRDGMEVLFVMIQGSMPWKIYENGYNDNIKQGKSTFSRRLVQGDFVYVPTGIYHVALPDSSRVGFSFGWGERPEKS